MTGSQVNEKRKKLTQVELKNNWTEVKIRHSVQKNEWKKSESNCKCKVIFSMLHSCPITVPSLTTSEGGVLLWGIDIEKMVYLAESLFLGF